MTFSKHSVNNTRVLQKVFGEMELKDNLFLCETILQLVFFTMYISHKLSEDFSCA